MLLLASGKMELLKFIFSENKAKKYMIQENAIKALKVVINK